MAVTVDQMAQAWRRREAQRAERAAHRAGRLMARLPNARRLLLDEYGASSVWLFGSLATGDGREDSDVDLAVEGLSAASYFHALSDLMAIFGGAVDLVRLEEAPAGLRERILTDGRPL
jgi:predicted nucleotidyltransferase